MKYYAHDVGPEPQSGTTLEQRRAEERERYRELQGALLQRHVQGHAEEAAIQRHYQHHALHGLKRLVDKGALPDNVLARKR